VRYSLKEIHASLPPEKRKTDGTMTAVFFRPIAEPVSWLFLRMGLTPNQVSFKSGVVCVAAFALSLFPPAIFHWLAIALFLFFGVLDCADGTMARTMGKKSRYGGWADAAGGYIAYATELFAIGMTSFFAYGDSYLGVALPWGGATWILAASFAALANTLMRLLHQAMKNVDLAAGDVADVGKEKRFSEEIGITGYLPFLYGIGFATGYLPFVFAVYFAVYVGGFAVTLARQVRKVALYSRKGL